MRQLEVGDNVVYIHHLKDDYRTFNFSEVVRVTKTQAILTDGTKLKINPIRGFNSTYRYENVLSYAFESWELVTPEILEDVEYQKEHQKMLDWFKRKSFSIEEKKLIYKHFEEQNLL